MVNNPRRFGRARGRGPNSGARLHQEIRALKNSVNGTKTTPAAIPRGFVQLPWNSWTYERSESTNGDFVDVFVTIANIATQLRGRIGLAESGELRIKIQSAQIWATVADTLVQPDLFARFYEINNESSNAPPRLEKRDLGTLNMPAKAGYIYPASDKREIIRPTDSGSVRVCSGQAAASGTTVTLRVQILWQQATQ
jgi:hypothetical protein